ncbi:MAG: hypothetical protein JWO22_1158 [Frankiales bacterium]|nr:hypothetical protein [Frankiales bacterium]
MTVVSWGGSAVELVGPDVLVDDVVACLPPFYDVGTQVSVGVTAELSLETGIATLHLDDGLGVSGPPSAEIHRACASRIELVLVDRLPDLVAVHAGVVADDRGVMLFPGRSMVGKSTLTRALLDAGCDYLSDEFALLGDDGRVHPYPRAMTLRTPTGSERHVPDNAVAVDAAPRGARLVALLTFGSAWETRDLTPGEATMGLIDNCVSIRREPARALTALTALAETAGAVAGTRGDAAETAARLMGR